MDEERKIRILMSKVGLDGHDRGLKVVSVLLRNEGFEVINLGRFQTAETIVSAAVQEDVDVIGLSILGDEYRIYVPRIIKLMKERGLNDVAFILGGVIPPDEIPKLKKAGVDEIFPSGTLLSTISQDIRKLVEKRRE
ncbi:MAG: cobalamin B12-binding domain-containing protein [Deltaproteobacteria bacterium]|nr:cobalamin B12-binding domain-containing protein [Deltaproteobacteria bacterium]